MAGKWIWEAKNDLNLYLPTNIIKQGNKSYNRLHNFQSGMKEKNW
jgi:hypothetical protein